MKPRQHPILPSEQKQQGRNKGSASLGLFFFFFLVAPDRAITQLTSENGSLWKLPESLPEMYAGLRVADEDWLLLVQLQLVAITILNKVLKFVLSHSISIILFDFWNGKK